MRYLKRILLTSAVALALGTTAAPSYAQISGGTLGGSSGGLGGSSGGLGGSSGGLGGSSGGLGGSSSGGLGGSGSSSSGGIQLTPPQIVAAPSAPTGSQSTTLDSSNFLSGYYANPYYQGINAMTGTVNPGGFGTPLAGTGGGTAGGASGRGATGTRSTTAGSTGRTGGVTGGTAGRGTNGMNNSTNQSGVVIPHPVTMSFPAVARFATPPVAATQLQTDLSGMFSRTEGISNPAGIQVMVQGNSVTLRGAVRDLEEARLIEGMTRLTPGVGIIKNELTFPVTAGQP